jgi:hypothetical protein
MSAAAPAILYIGPSYANKSNTRFVDKITDPSTAPPQYDDLELLQKYFSSKTPADYSTMPEEDKKGILRMLSARKDSLVETLNALKRTGTISLKNASMTNKIQHMNELMEEVNSGRGMAAPKVVAAPAPAPVPSPPACPVISPAPGATTTLPVAAAGSTATSPSPAVDNTPLKEDEIKGMRYTMDRIFGAAYFLLRRDDPSESAETFIKEWNLKKAAEPRLTVGDVMKTLKQPNTGSIVSPADAITYLLNTHLMFTILPNPTTVAEGIAFKKKFAAKLERIKAVIDAMPQNKALFEGLSPPPATKLLEVYELLRELMSLTPTEKSRITPGDTLLMPLRSAPEALRRGGFNEFVYLTSYLLLQQFIAENK